MTERSVFCIFEINIKNLIMKNTISLICLTLPTLLILTLSSCSSKPSESRAEKDLREIIHSESSGNLELIEFEKTNAAERELFGQKAYAIEYKATLRVKENCYMYVNGYGYGLFFKNFKTYDKSPTFIPGRKVVTCTKGKEVDFSDIIKYVETEEGWIKVKKSMFD